MSGLQPVQEGWLKQGQGAHRGVESAQHGPKGPDQTVLKSTGSTRWQRKISKFWRLTFTHQARDESAVAKQRHAAIGAHHQWMSP